MLCHLCPRPKGDARPADLVLGRLDAVSSPFGRCSSLLCFPARINDLHGRIELPYLIALMLLGLLFSFNHSSGGLEAVLIRIGYRFVWMAGQTVHPGSPRRRTPATQKTTLLKSRRVSTRPTAKKFFACMPSRRNHQRAMLPAGTLLDTSGPIAPPPHGVWLVTNRSDNVPNGSPNCVTVRFFGASCSGILSRRCDP